MAVKASMKLGLQLAEGKKDSKVINNINPEATDTQLSAVARQLESVQKHSLVSVSKTITSDITLQ